MTCHYCGDLLTDDFEYMNGYACCPACARRYSPTRGRLLPYSTKPTPRFLGKDKNEVSGMFLGVELEVDENVTSGLPDRQTAVSETGALTDDVYLKTDGSLRSGYEIVSHPASFHYHMNELPWKEIFSVASRNGFRSHDTTTCGLHVHLNRDYFGKGKQAQDYGAAKLLILVNNIWPQLVTLSRRDIHHLSAWARKVDLDTKVDDTRGQVTEKARRTAMMGRYQAINLTNAKTVEFRLYRGTLSHETFRATLQLTRCLARYAHCHGLSTIQVTTWAMFKEFALNCGHTKELADYISSKGL